MIKHGFVTLENGKFIDHNPDHDEGLEDMLNDVDRNTNHHMSPLAKVLYAYADDVRSECAYLWRSDGELYFKNRYDEDEAFEFRLVLSDKGRSLKVFNNESQCLITSAMNSMDVMNALERLKDYGDVCS